MSSRLEGANIFVTGADGFIGSHLVEKLLAAQGNVTAMVYYNSWNSIGWLNDIPPNLRKNMNIVAGDVRDSRWIEKSLSNQDYVFHLASLIGIPYSYVAPESYINTNVIGTLNILEAARRSDRIQRVVHFSTSEVYGSAQYIPMDEKHPQVAQSPYAASKIAADKVVESYHLSFDVPATIVRPFNTYGPRQTPRAIIPTVINQYLSDSDFVELGDLTPYRDFNYVTDTVEAVILTALCDSSIGEVVNIGSGSAITIDALCNHVSEILGRDKRKVSVPGRLRPPKSEVTKLVACSNKLMSLTPWKQNISVRKGLELTIEWARKRDYRSTGHHFDI